MRLPECRRGAGFGSLFVSAKKNKEEGVGLKSADTLEILDGKGRYVLTVYLLKGKKVQSGFGAGRMPRLITRNMLFYGDNLVILLEHISEESVALIFPDPADDHDLLRLNCGRCLHPDIGRGRPSKGRTIEVPRSMPSHVKQAKKVKKKRASPKEKSKAARQGSLNAHRPFGAVAGRVGHQ